MSKALAKTYALKEGPPHIPFAEYMERTRQKFSGLLDSDPCERKIQSFLEKHPAMVPGHSTPSGISGHYPLHCCLITQPVLPGMPSYTPDFMWIARHSGGWFPTLIEIEKPGKKLFTKKGDQTSHFSQACNQLNHWRLWFKNQSNVQLFMDFYGIPSGWKRLDWRLHMLLIYGRRDEFKDRPPLVGLRDGLLPGADQELMSFDRLGVHPHFRDVITVKATGSGRYRAVHVPDTFATGPDLADRLPYIDDIAEAIDSNEDIQEERREFLKERIIYWRKWTSGSSRGLIIVGDRE